MKPRRQRRQESRDTSTPFVPQYSSGVRFDKAGNEIKTGGKPQSYEETYGVGYERFDNKYVKVSDKP